MERLDLVPAAVVLGRVLRVELRSQRRRGVRMREERARGRFGAERACAGKPERRLRGISVVDGRGVRRDSADCSRRDRGVRRDSSKEHPESAREENRARRGRLCGSRTPPRRWATRGRSRGSATRRFWPARSARCTKRWRTAAPSESARLRRSSRPSDVTSHPTAENGSGPRPGRRLR